MQYNNTQHHKNVNAMYIVIRILIEGRNTLYHIFLRKNIIKYILVLFKTDS